MKKLLLFMVIFVIPNVKGVKVQVKTPNSSLNTLIDLEPSRINTGLDLLQLMPPEYQNDITLFSFNGHMIKLDHTNIKPLINRLITEHAQDLLTGHPHKRLKDLIK